MMRKKHFRIVATVAGVLVMAFVLTYFLMSGTMSTINDVSEKEALALLTENAMQMDNIIENQLTNNWKQIDTICVALENMEDHSADMVASFLQDASTDAYDMLLLSDESTYLDRTGGWGSKPISKDTLPLMQGKERIILLRQDNDTDLLMFGKRIKPLYVEAEKMEYLFVYYRLDSYMGLLKMESFGGNGQIRIIDSKGTTLLHSDNLWASENRYLFFGTFKDAQFLHHEVVKDSDSFREYVLSGKSDAIHVVLGSGEDEIISFSKIPDIDWHIVISIDQSLVMGTRILSVEKIGRTSQLAVVFIVMFSLITIFFVVYQSQKKTNAQNRELEKLNEQLRENNASLEEARHLAEQSFHVAESANKAKSTFLSNMSHDIRTPMNAIIGFTNIGLKQNPSPELRNCLEKISNSSEHLLTLINDVLDISRIESGKIQYAPTPTDIREVTDTVLNIMHGFLFNRNITFSVNRAVLETPYVLVDAVRIREILVNILGNAVKFTDDGDTITFEMSNHPGKDDRHIVVSYRISDTGVGMSEEFVEHIFDEFSQEENSARTQYKGTGLGMAITKRFVDLMGGTISVESKKNEGSTFIVEIPMELIEESEVQKQGIPADKADLAGVKILMAEDNELNAEIAMVQLEEVGIQVTRAADGKEAVKIFAENPSGTYDMILMDIMMPEMNGYEATKAIRSMHDRPDDCDIPIIAMTANAFAEDVQASLDAGMNGHIAKPINIDEVIKAIVRNVNR